MKHYLKTIGHATLVILEDGRPLLATDPWLVGSNYWRSWWLEKYPGEEEIDLVRNARGLYVTHSHPDHFHWPSLRRIGPRSTLLPSFPDYAVPAFLEAHGFTARCLKPWRWHAISTDVRIASVPLPIDDSILVIDTPATVVVNLNDATPRRGLLRIVKDWLLTPGKRVVVLKSYSPASMGSALYCADKRVPMKSKVDYANVARGMAETLGASQFVPFASQAFFNRTDSMWANDFKVTYEDLASNWGSSPVELCRPFVTMDLGDGSYTSRYEEAKRTLAVSQREKVRAREAEEALFQAPPDFDVRLKRYLDEVIFLRIFFRSGIGWRLTDSGAEKFYNSRTRQVENSIPPGHDFVISLPDQVLYESLCNNVLTDLGITMFIRVDTRVGRKVTYGAFLLMALHDYGHFKSFRSMARFGLFYLPYVFPWMLRVRRTAFLGRSR